MIQIIDIIDEFDLFLIFIVFDCCDSCGVQVYVWVMFVFGELLFCVYYGVKFKEKLVLIVIVWYDESFCFDVVLIFEQGVIGGVVF